jgi:hypothetical protein
MLPDGARPWFDESFRENNRPHLANTNDSCKGLGGTLGPRIFESQFYPGFVP